jgi:hypothetical protein
MNSDDLPRAQGIARFDFDRYDDLYGQSTCRITAKIDADDPRPTWWEMVVMGETLGLHITVNWETDELIVALTNVAEPGGGHWIDVEQLADCIGCKIGWCWSAINSQGYWDLFTLSFEGGVIPSVAFLGMASEVHVMRMAPVEQPSAPKVLER